jgi:hypothetical protein
LVLSLLVVVAAFAPCWGARAFAQTNRDGNGRGGCEPKILCGVCSALGAQECHVIACNGSVTGFTQSCDPPPPCQPTLTECDPTCPSTGVKQCREVDCQNTVIRNFAQSCAFTTCSECALHSCDQGAGLLYGYTVTTHHPDGTTTESDLQGSFKDTLGQNACIDDITDKEYLQQNELHCTNTLKADPACH